MAQHAFIFESGLWVGEGRVRFSSSPDQVKFYTKWTIPKNLKQATGEEGSCSQQVEMLGSNEQVVNKFVITMQSQNSFMISLENEMVGKVQGKGIVDEKTIAWEFRGHPGFEGFEVYELTDNGDYMLHAEYASPDQFRTMIEGRIWKKAASS